MLRLALHNHTQHSSVFVRNDQEPLTRRVSALCSIECFESIGVKDAEVHLRNCPLCPGGLAAERVPFLSPRTNAVFAPRRSGEMDWVSSCRSLSSSLGAPGAGSTVCWMSTDCASVRLSSTVCSRISRTGLSTDCTMVRSTPWRILSFSSLTVSEDDATVTWRRDEQSSLVLD